MDHVYYSVNDNVNPVRIGRTDIVAKLLVAKDTPLAVGCAMQVLGIRTN